MISRTSVMRYRNFRDAKKIARSLNVSHLLEGSIRKAGTKIHVNVQLIDATNDLHVGRKNTIVTRTMFSRFKASRAESGRATSRQSVACRKTIDQTSAYHRPNRF